MAETTEIFRGKSIYEVESQQALSSLDELSQESRKALGVVSNELNRASKRVKEFGSETASVMDGIGLMMRPPQRRFGELVSTFRLGFKQITGEAGNVGVGLRTMGDVLGEVTARKPALQGLSKTFYAVANAGEKLGSAINWVRNLNRGAIRDWQAVAAAMARNTNAGKMMVKGLKEMHQVRINEVKEKIRANVANIREERQIQKLIDRYQDLGKMMKSATSEKGRESIQARMAAVGEQLKRAKVDVDNLSGAYNGTIQEINRLRAANEGYRNEVEMMVHNQRPQIQSIASLFGTVDTHVRYLSGTLQKVQEGTAKAGDIQERRLHMAMQAVKNLRQEMQRFQKMGGKLDPQMLRFYGEQKRSLDLLINTLRQKKAEEQKAEQQTVKSARSSAVAVEQGARRSTQAIRGYSDATRQAASSNRMLMQYVAPRGAMNMGMMHLGQVTTATGRNVQQFSMSMGSMVGVASLVGATMGKMDPAFAAVATGVSTMADQAIRSFGAMASVAGTSAEKVKAAMAIMSNSLMAFGAMATGFIVKTGMIGAEVKTLEVTMRTIAKFIAKEAGADMDKAADYVVRLTDKVRLAGITTRESMTAMIAFLRGRMPVERLQELAGAAKDFGVTVASMSTSEVLGRFNQFIMAGTTALLKRIGITTTADMMHERYAKTIGKSKEDLTDYEKRMARFEGILKETEVTQGVYNEAMKTAGKQLSSMKRLIEEAALTLGRRFEPILAKVIFGVNKLLKWFTSLSPEIHDNIAAFIKWAAAVGLGLGAALGLIPALKGIISLVTILSKKLLLASPKILAISIALGAIITVAKALKKAWDENFGGLQETISDFLKMLKSEFKPIFDDLLYWVRTFGKQIEHIVVLLAENLKMVFAIISGLIKKVKISQAFQTIRDALNGFMRAVSRVMLVIQSLLRALSGKGEWGFAWKHAEAAVIDVTTSIALLFKNVVAKAAIWGWNLIVEVANGITKAATTVLARAMKWIGDTIARFLAPGSPPKEGPLRHIIKWGKGVMATYLRAFGLADFGMLKDIMAPIGKALQDAVTMGKMGEGVMKSTLRTVRQQVASLLVDFRKTGVVNEEIMGSISDSLGAGGEDLMEYIKRLMAHQKAMKNLADVQKEYAEAEATGFVTAEMKDRLKAAEEEANATKEAVDWQKEFLAAQQETLDLQQKQVEALEKMADAVGKIADSMGDVADDALEWIIPDAPEVESMFDDLGVKLGLGAVSEEWLEMREQIEGFIQGVKDFLALPIKGKLDILKGWAAETGTKIVKWLEDLTGLDVSGWLDTLATKWEEAWGSIETWATTTWETDVKPKLNEFSVWFEETWPKALEIAKEKTEEVWDWIVEKTQWLYDKLVGKSIVPDLIGSEGGGGIIGWFDKLEQWFKNSKLYQSIEAIGGFFEEVGKFVKALGVSAALVGVVAFFVKIGAIAAPVVAFFTSIGETIALVAMYAAQAGAALTGFLAPILGIAAAIGALLWGIWENKDQILGFWEDFKTEVLSVWERLKPSLEAFWRVAEPIFLAIGKMLARIVGGGIMVVIAAAQSLWENIKELLPKIKEIFSGVFDVIYGLVKTFILPIVNIIVGLFNLITGHGDEAKESFLAAWENLKEGVGLIWEGIKKIIVNAITGAFDFITGLGPTFLSKLAKLGGEVAERLGMGDVVSKIKEFGKTVKRFWRPVKKFFGLMGWFFKYLKGAKNLKDFFERFKAVLPWMKEALSGIAAKIWETVKGGIGKVIGFLRANIPIWARAVGERLKEWLTRAIDYFKRNIPLWTTNLAYIFGQLVGKLMKALPGILAAIGIAIGGWIPLLIAWVGKMGAKLGAWLVEHWPEWRDKFVKFWADVWAGFVKWLTTELPVWIESFTSWLGNVWDGFQAWLAEDLPKWIKAFSDWITLVWANFILWLVEELPKWRQGLVDWFTDVWAAFIAGVREEGPQWLLDLQDWFTKLRADFALWLIVELPRWVSALSTWFTRMWAEFALWLIVELPQWRKAYEDWFVKLWAGFILWLLTEYPAWSEGLRAWFVKLWAGFILWLLEEDPVWVEDLKEYWRRLLKVFIEWLLTDVMTWDDTLKAYEDWFTSVWLGFIAWLWEEMPQWIETLSSFFTALWLGFAQWLIDEWAIFEADLIQVGVNMVAGILVGLAEAWPSIETFLKNKMEGMINIVKWGLGIESPSKAFMEIGQQMVAGLREGLDFSGIDGDIMRGLGLNGLSGQFGAQLAGFAGQLTTAAPSPQRPNDYHFGQGAFAGAFPNVRDGRDGGDLVRQFQQYLSDADLRARGT